MRVRKKVEGWKVSAAARRARGAPSRAPALCRFGPQREPQPRRGGGGGGGRARGAAGRWGDTPLPKTAPELCPQRARVAGRHIKTIVHNVVVLKEEPVPWKATYEHLRCSSAQLEHRWRRYPACTPPVLQPRVFGEGQAAGRTAPPELTGQLRAECSEPKSSGIKAPDWIS